jgi:hypothetical protein
MALLDFADVALETTLQILKRLSDQRKINLHNCAHCFSTLALPRHARAECPCADPILCGIFLRDADEFELLCSEGADFWSSDFSLQTPRVGR